MPVKHFIINPKKEKIIGGDTSIKDMELISHLGYESARENDIKKLQEEDNLKCVPGRIIIKIDIESKNSWKFDSGLKLRYERNFNNFNRNYTQPVNCFVVDAEDIPSKVQILVHPNAIHDTYRIFNYKTDTGNIQYYSIFPEQCFAWYDGNEWQPLKPYDFALRVFKPYEGLISGIEPTQLKDTLFVTTGKLKGNVVKTIKASDYQIIFQDINGREGNIVRFRPFVDPSTQREKEAIAILHDLTEQVNNGKLLIGLTIKDAEPLKDVIKNNFTVESCNVNFKNVTIL